MLTTVRDVQIPLLAAMLLGACLAKAWRAMRPHAHPARSDPAGLFPTHLRRPIMILVFVAELGLGLGLIGTAVTFGRNWPALPATVVRTGTALIFLVAVGVLNEMRQRRPDSGLRLLRRAQARRGPRSDRNPGVCGSRGNSKNRARQPDSRIERPGRRSSRWVRRAPVALRSFVGFGCYDVL